MVRGMILMLAALCAQVSYAYDPQKCFKVVHANGLVKYDYPGYLSSEYMTKKYGTTGGTVQYSSQSSTSLIDPFVSTGKFLSTTQFTSSEGGCSYFSYNREMRRDYFERNGEHIREAIALGRGEHLRSLYFYSMCQDGGLHVFSAELQKHYESFLNDTDTAIDEIDRIVRGNNTLSALCELS